MPFEMNPERIADVRTAALQLLDRRSDRATICPSEVAKIVAGKGGADPKGQSWRVAMPVVHAAIDQMLTDGVIELSWKGRVMASRSGPYRIGRAQAER